MVTTDHYPDGLIEVSGEADVVFVNGAPQSVDNDIAIYWDLDNDGNFSDPLENITPYVRSAESFIGRDFPSEVNGHAQAGTLILELDNSDNRWSTLNQASPVNTGPMSLRPGRRVQVRTVGTADPRPALLARDRFLGVAGPLTVDETGKTWETGFTHAFTRSGAGEAVASASATGGDVHVSLIDTGATNYAVVARLSTIGAKTGGLLGNTAGIVYRWQDALNYSRLELDVDAGLLRLINTTGGVDATASTAGIEARDGFMLCMVVLGANCSAYLDGVNIMNTAAPQTDETHVGIWGEWGATRQPMPGIDLFEVWSGTQATVAGVLWTGEVETVATTPGRARQRTATVRCIGALSHLIDRQIDAFRFNVGQGAGFMVGRVLNHAGQLSPPIGGTPVDAGTVALGLITADTTTVEALELARGFELAERGFLHERAEGGLAFNSATARTNDARSNTVQAWFSDAPGAQLGFEAIEPIDAVRDVVNRVRASVAGAIPAATSLQVAGQSAAGVANHIARTFAPTPTAGALHVFVIASTVRVAGQDWRSPSGYTPHRNLDDGSAFGIRVYSRVMDGTEASVTFYNDSPVSGGNWRLLELIYPPGTWYGDPSGLYVSDVTEGSNPGALFPPWDGAGTEFVTVRAGIGSTIGAAIGSPVGTVAPLGYTTLTDAFDNGIGAQGFDLGLQSAYRRDVFGFQDPSTWDGTFGQFNIIETVTVAVRGYNGNPPERSGARVLEFDDVASQDDHGQVLALDATAAPFANTAEAQAYATGVLSAYRNERPLMELTFTASRNALARAAAVALRTNDRVHVDAAHPDPSSSGIGYQGDAFVEYVRHRWSNGGKLWECTLGLSPA